MKSSPWMELPPPVARHVRQQLETIDWDAAVQQLRSVCADCPARQQDTDEICLACPFDGLACMAATVTLKARIAKMQAKSKNGKKVKSSLSQITEKVEAKSKNGKKVKSSLSQITEKVEANK